MIAVAVNITLVPGQIALFDTFETILTLTGRLSLTVIAIALLAAGLPNAHGAMFDIISTVTTSPLISEDVL